jgi:hypothetical protein
MSASDSAFRRRVNARRSGRVHKSGIVGTEERWSKFIPFENRLRVVGNDLAHDLVMIVEDLRRVGGGDLRFESAPTFAANETWSKSIGETGKVGASLTGTGQSDVAAKPASARVRRHQPRTCPQGHIGRS